MTINSKNPGFSPFSPFLGQKDFFKKNLGLSHTRDGPFPSDPSLPSGDIMPKFEKRIFAWH